MSVRECLVVHLGAPKICPRRFGVSPPGSNRCYRLLHDNKFLRGNGTHQEVKSINEYRTCTAHVQNVSLLCSEKSSSVCSSKGVSIAKAVRARMFHVEGLIQRFPKLRIIHMYRDPRPVVSSRRSYGVLSLYGKSDLRNEAELYCRQLNEDIILRRRLEEKYPGQFMEVLFQDLDGHPNYTLHKVFNFVGLPWSSDLDVWLQEHTEQKKKGIAVSRNSTTVITRWRDKMSNDTISKINSACRDLYDTTGRIWPVMDL